MTALEPIREPEEQSPTLLRLPAATGMLRGALVLHAPERRRVDAVSDLGRNSVTDANVEAFIAELRALGGMAVIA